MLDHSDGGPGLSVVADVYTSSGKRVVAISSGTCRSALNRKHTLVHIDGTFKTSPKYFTQIWIVSGYEGSTCVPFMYILIEDKTCSSYSKAIEVLKSYCPDFDSDSFMVDFEKAEHSVIRSHFIDAIIKGCLFYWKQCLNRKFKAVVGYEDNELLRNYLHTVFGLAFVPVDDVLHGWSLLKPLLMQYPAAAPLTFHRLLPEELAIQPELSNFDVELL